MSTLRTPLGESKKTNSFAKKRNTVKMNTVDVNVEVSLNLIKLTMKHQEQMYKLELLQREEKERKILENTISLAEPEFQSFNPLGLFSIKKSKFSK